MKIKLENASKLGKFLKNNPVKKIVNVETFTDALPNSESSLDSLKLVNRYNKLKYSSFDNSKEIPIIYWDFSTLSNFLKFNFKNIETV